MYEYLECFMVGGLTVFFLMLLAGILIQVINRKNEKPEA